MSMKVEGEDPVLNIPDALGEEERSKMLERVVSYRGLFELNRETLVRIHEDFVKEIEIGLQLHKKEVPWDINRCSLKLLDTCVDKLPTGEEQGSCFAVDFGGSNIRGIYAKLKGKGKIKMKTERRVLLEETEHRKGLLDKDATATELFDCMAGLVKKAMKHGHSLHGDVRPIGFTFSFPIVQTDVRSASLVHWTKDFETGRNTNDPVENRNIGQLLDQAFLRAEVPGVTTAVINDTTGTLISCAYEKPANTPPCVMSIIIGTGVNGCYVDSECKRYGYIGSVINTELGSFNRDLPRNDVDIEVDFANDANRGTQIYEKMISGKYIGEVARRLIVKVYQHRAPVLAWSRESFPPAMCMVIISDDTPTRQYTDLILRNLWEWETTEEDRMVIQDLVRMAFDRSTALAAVMISALASRTGRMQPAMGGVTCGVDGSLFTENVWYQDRVRHYLKLILGSGAALIHLIVTKDGSGKGGAILARLNKSV